MKTTTTSSYDLVQEFMQQNEASLADAVPDPSAVLMRLSLVVEELSETIIAMHDGNLVDTADGLIDLKYVTVGMAVFFGLPIMDNFGTPVLTCDLTPEFALNTSGILLVYLGKLAVQARTFNQETPGQLSMALEDLDSAITVACCRLGLPVEALFKEVHRSNMSKDLGGAKNDKYGPNGGKGASYSPPDVFGLLLKAGLVLPR